ncbi:MAG: glycerophosphoryl diester phosphodiesterase [Abditibacteriota bacterium]|nr:glycerophosphoryl diester phosphodiesterase [Abditibacteriota bacterium]
MANTSSKNRIEVIGHRGAAAVEPENTLRGLRYALSLGVHRAEIDVHLSRDHELVVMHDVTVDRTTNGSGKIAELSLAQIQQLDAGRGERVPTLQEVIDLFIEAWNQGIETLLQIELKGENTAAPTVETVQRNGIEGRVVLTSFHSERVAEAKRLLPEAIFGLLTSSLEPDPLEVALRVGAGAIHLRHDLVTPEWIERVRVAGLQARVWNIDEVERMKWAIALGVDGIGSNNPQLLMELLARPTEA